MVMHCSVDVCVHRSPSSKFGNKIFPFISPVAQRELFFFSGLVLSVMAGLVTDTGVDVTVLNECEVEFLSRGADGGLLAR